MAILIIVITMQSVYAQESSVDLENIHTVYIKSLLIASSPHQNESDPNATSFSQGVKLRNANDTFAALSSVVQNPEMGKELVEIIGASRPLGPYEPFSWSAIPAEVCIAAQLAPRRCVSLTCLMLNGSDPAGLAACNISPNEAAGGFIDRSSTDPGGAFGDALKKIPREGLPQDIADALSDGRLLVEEQNISAKGMLHALWPAIVLKAKEEGVPTHENLTSFVGDIVSQEIRRSTEATQVIATAGIIETLPDSTIAILKSGNADVETALSGLSKAADALRLVYDEPENLIRLPDEADGSILQGQDAVKVLYRAALKLIDSLRVLPVNGLTPAAPSETCPSAHDASLHIIASRRVDLRGAPREALFSLALNEIGRSSEGEISAELVGVVAVAPQGAEAPAMASSTNALVPSNCVREIYPLGVTIRRLREDKDYLFSVAADNEIVQRTNSTVFRAGLTDLAGRLKWPTDWPVGISVDEILLEFSPDFRNVKLKTSLTMSSPTFRHRATVPLIVDGAIPDRFDIASLLGLNDLVDAMNASISSNNLKVSYGMLDAKLIKFELADLSRSMSNDNPETVPDQRWLFAYLQVHVDRVKIDPI
ncbi:MAG: hypothetical protein ACK52I_02610, partial [Pseudomonadota bacterium]